MPGMDRECLGYDVMSGKVAAAIPYSWEAAPGKPISEAVCDTFEPLRTPLAPPPGSSGVRRPATFVEPTFGGFAPETDVSKSSGPHFAEKLFKKLHAKLRKKSKVLAASLSLEKLRALMEHKKRTVAIEDSVQNGSRYDSDERDGGSWSSFSTVEQPDTPSSSSVSMSSSSSISSCESISYPSLHHQAANMLGNDNNSEDSEDEEPESEEYTNGPRESAWHEDSADEDEELTEQEWQIVRYASLQGRNSSLISTLVRQSSLTPLGTEHSYRLSPIKGRKSETS